MDQNSDPTNNNNNPTSNEPLASPPSAPSSSSSPNPPRPIINPTPAAPASSITPPAPEPSPALAPSSVPQPSPMSQPAQPPQVPPQTPPSTQPAQPTSAAQAPQIPQPSQSQPAPAQPSSSSPSPKKKKGIIIASIIAAAVLLTVIVITAAFAVVRNQPEVIAADAITQLLSANNLKVSGEISYTAPLDDYNYVYGSEDSSDTNCVSTAYEEDEDDIDYYTNCMSIRAAGPTLTNLTLTLDDHAQSGAAYTTSAKISATFDNDPDTTIALDIGETFVKDGTIYLKVDGLKSAIATADEVYLEGALSDESASAFAEILDGIIAKIDGTWWAISIPEIIDHIDSLTASNKAGLKDAYSCAVTELNSIFSNNAELAKLYQDHPFVSIAENKANPSGKSAFGADYTNYSLYLKSTELTDYYNQAIKTVDFTRFQTCLDQSSLLSSVKIPTALTSGLKSSTVEEIVKELPSINLGITGWSHQLVSLNAATIPEDEYDSTYSLDLSFDYPASVDISAPADAKSALDLYEDIVQLITASFYNSALSEKAE